MPAPVLHLHPDLPHGWDLNPVGLDHFRAVNARDGFRTAEHESRQDCIDEARAIHAREIAAGDIFDAEPVSIEVEAAPGDVQPVEHAKPVPVEVVARERIEALGSDAYDAASGEWKTVSPAMVERERQMREAWGLSKLMQAVVVREVFDNRLYLAAGCETREEYAEQVLNCGRTTAHNLYKTASRLGPFLPSADGLRQLAAGDVQPVEHGEVGALLVDTPISNLYELVKLDDDDLDSILDGSALTLADGRTVSVEDFKRASRREATDLVKDLKREYRAKLARDQERADLAEAERDVYRERAEEAEGTVSTLRDGERLWGPRQLHAEGQIKLMESAEQHLKALGLAVDQIDPDADVPDAVARAAASLLHRFETHAGNLRDRLAPITARL